MASTQPAQTAQSYPVFDSTSVGFQAMIYASKGQLELLRTLTGDCLSLLGRVSSKTEDCFAPAHYAIQRNHWPVAAFLLNQGADFTLKSIRMGGVGKTPIDLINGKENGLCHLVQALANNPDSIDVEALFSLISSPLLSVGRRQELLYDFAIRTALCKRLKKDEALLVIVALHIGSYHWASFVDGMRLLKQGKIISPHDPLNCSNLLIHASYLTGLYTLTEIADLAAKELPTLKEVFGKEFAQLTEEERFSYSRLINSKYSSNLGLDRRAKSQPLHSFSDAHLPKIQVVFFEGNNGLICHFGLFYKGSKGNFIIHISDLTKTVVCQKAEDVVVTESEYVRAIYTSMLPWHETP